MRALLSTIHEYITTKMSESWIVENILIAEVTTEEDGQIVTYDCIYCTILRVAVLFMLLGILIGWMIWQ